MNVNINKRKLKNLLTKINIFALYSKIYQLFNILEAIFFIKINWLTKLFGMLKTL